MKSIKEWLESIKDDTIRAEALENTRVQGFDSKRVKSSLYTAIVNAFIWGHTTQGDAYWREVAESLRALEQSTNP